MGIIRLLPDLTLDRILYMTNNLFANTSVHDFILRAVYFGGGRKQAWKAWDASKKVCVLIFSAALSAIF